MTSFAADFKEPGPKDTCNPVTSRLMVFTKHRYGLKGRSRAAPCKTTAPSSSITSGCRTTTLQRLRRIESGSI